MSYRQQYLFWMIRRLDTERLESILRAFFHPAEEQGGLRGVLRRLSTTLNRKPREVS